jgi:hypothetical protein
LGERIEAATVVAPEGSDVNLYGLLARILGRTALPFPRPCLVAVTPTRVAIFGFVFANGTQLSPPAAIWPRESVRVTRRSDPYRIWFEIPAERKRIGVLAYQRDEAANLLISRLDHGSP